LTSKVSKKELDQYLGAPYKSMIKFVVDIKQRIIALGGEMHADAEQVLLQNGSFQENLWGANIYPARSKDEALEYFSLINIRPSDSNFSLEIADPEVQEQVKSVVFEWIEL